VMLTGLSAVDMRANGRRVGIEHTTSHARKEI